MMENPVGADGEFRDPDLRCTKPLLYHLSYISIWSEWRGSNSRPRGPKPRVLSTELHPDIKGDSKNGTAASRSIWKPLAHRF